MVPLSIYVGRYIPNVPVTRYIYVKMPSTSPPNILSFFINVLECARVMLRGLSYHVYAAGSRQYVYYVVSMQCNQKYADRFDHHEFSIFQVNQMAYSNDYYLFVRFPFII